MDYKTGFSRNQLHMFTESLDDAIPKDHPVRFIDAYINQLDLAKLKVKLPKLKTGRPPFHPGLLLKIYVYCYFEKIRTSRMIEKECKRNIELKWLSEGLAPDHKTIANFRKDNKLALKEIFKAFLNFCYDQNLFDLKLVALDGTKLRAQNSSNEVYKRETIDQTQKKIEERIKEYMEQLDENDKKEDLSLDTEKINKALEKLKKKQTILEKVKKRFEDDPELKRIFRVDPDSTFQSDKGQKAPGYNCQIVVDSKNKLIVTVDITNEQNDGRQLTPMLNKLLELKNDLAQEHLEEVSIMVCDAGYHNEQQILKSLETKSAEVLVTDRDEARKNNDAIGKRRNSKVVPGKGFKKKDFRINLKEGHCTCPEGKKLYPTNSEPKTVHSGLEVFNFRCPECKNCPSIHFCTKSKSGRTITVSATHDEFESYKKKVAEKENMQLLKKRKEIVEHPFGTIKRSLGFTYFLQRGAEKVRAEFNFMCFIYNLKRVINIFSVESLLKTLKS